MDKKLNDFLVEEIKKGVESLNKDKIQIEEFNKFDGRDGVQGIGQFQSDLIKIKAELKEKESELEQIQVANKTKEQIEAEEASIKLEYAKLLKQKEQCEAEIKKVEGKMELKDGMFIPTKEHEEYKRELEKINASISKFELLKNQHKTELQQQESIVENLYKKYNIREKYNESQEKQQQEIGKKSQSQKYADEHLRDREKQEELRKQQEDEMWEEYRKNKEKEEQEQSKRKQADIDKAYEEKQQQENKEEIQRDSKSKKETDEYFKDYEAEQKGEETDELIEECKTLLGENNQKDRIIAENFKKFQQEQETQTKPDIKNRKDKLQAIDCKIENGKLKYVITYKNERGEQNHFEVNDIAPHKMTKAEKKNLKKDLNRVYFYGIDNEVVRALLRNDDVANSDFYNQYISFAKEMMNGKGRNQKNIDITYDLSELRNADLTKKEKRVLKKIAKNSQEAFVGSYIKPKSRFKIFMERLKQKRLEPAAKNQGISQSDIMFKNLVDLADEKGFDINLFIKQQEAERGKEFSLQEKNNIIQQYGKIVTESQNDIRHRVKYDVSGKGDAKGQGTETSKNNEGKQQEQEQKQSGREPGDE